jgi:hypothetical protein
VLTAPLCVVARRLPNGARRSEIEDGFAAEVDVEGGEVVHVLGYGMTPDEFDGVASSL